MAPAQALQTSKRKFYKLLDNLSTPRVNSPSKSTLTSASHENLPSTLSQPSTSSLTPSEPPSKRSRLSAALDSHRASPHNRPDRTTSPTAEKDSDFRAYLKHFRPKNRPASSSIRVVGTKPGVDRPTTSSSTRNITGTSGDTASSRATPNYTPYSQETFHARLKTYSDVKLWTPKPDGLSEVEWAKRGWVCLGEKDGVDWTKGQKDTVGCRGGCEKRVVIRLVKGQNGEISNKNHDEFGEQIINNEDWRYDTELEKELVERYSRLIVEGHDEGCLWRKIGCKDDIYRIRFGDSRQWQYELKERYDSLLAVEDALPERLKLPEAESRTKLDTEKLSRLLKDYLLPSEQARPAIAASSDPSANPTDARTTTKDSSTGYIAAVNQTALTLALTGWTAHKAHKLSLAQCQHCFQRIGLWLYTSNSGTKPLSASVSGIPDHDILDFDPVDLHRQHCPWRNPDTQRAVGNLEGLAGWEVMVRLSAGLRRREGMQSAHGRSKSVPNVGGDASDGEAEQRIVKSKEDIEKEDRVRESRLRKLKKALSVKKRKSVS